MSIAAFTMTMDRIKVAEPGRDIAVFDIGSKHSFDSYFTDVAPPETSERRLIGHFNNEMNVREVRSRLGAALLRNADAA